MRALIFPHRCFLYNPVGGQFVLGKMLKVNEAQGPKIVIVFFKFPVELFCLTWSMFDSHVFDATKVSGSYLMA